MSLFFRYNRPGKGVSKEDAENRNYFVILFRKFSLIIKANLLFCATNILLLLALLLPVFSLFGDTADQAVSYYATILSGKQLMSPLPFVILALFAPTFAGLTYLCRNFARQEHVFLVSDFFEQTKKNWKQSIAAGFILSAVLYLYLTAFFFYWNWGSIAMLIAAFFLGTLMLYASFYVFPQIVTYRLSLWQIFKNAIILALVNLPYNALALVCLAALHVFLILKMPILWLILLPVFLIAFTAFTINFVTSGAMSKYMIADTADNNPTAGTTVEKDEQIEKMA